MSVTAFPSMSVGDMVTAPVAVASSDTSNCSSPLPISGISLTSASALFLLEEREDEDPVNLDTVTREDGLGDSFSLKQEEKMMLLESMLLQRYQQPNLIQVSLSTHPTHGAYSKYWLWWHPHDKILLLRKKTLSISKYHTYRYLGFRYLKVQMQLWLLFSFC